MTMTLRRSRSFPVAGCLAILLIASFDQLLLGQGGPWSRFQELVTSPLARGTVVDQIELRRLAKADGAKKRVVIVGSSRANAAFLPGSLRSSSPGGLNYYKVAHAGVGTYEIRAVADRVAHHRVDAYVIYYSEFDLFRPVQPADRSAESSLGAVSALLSSLDFHSIVGGRTRLARLSVKSLSNGYRFRDVLQEAGLGRWRDFELDERFTPSSSRRVGHSALVAAGTRRAFGNSDRHQLEAEIRRLFPHLSPTAVRAGFQQMHVLRRGRHAEVQGQLLRSTIERLEDTGCLVLLVEAPVHPLATEIYDPALRNDYLRLVGSLEEETSLAFLPLESTGPFATTDFRDLAHLGVPRAREFSVAVDQRVRSLVLEQAGRAGDR